MKTVLRLTSARRGLAELWLEPWGDRVCLTPEATYEVVTSGESPTIEWGEASLTVWANGELQVKRDGVPVWPPAPISTGAARPA